MYIDVGISNALLQLYLSHAGLVQILAAQYSWLLHFSFLLRKIR